MGNKRLQILVSAVNKDAKVLPQLMNLESDAVIVNQIQEKREVSESSDGQNEAGMKHQDLPECEDYSFDYNGHAIKVLNRREKGVGLSRNTAFDNSDAEIIQFGDDDIRYSDGYAQRILAEFDAHPEADVILFNVKAQAGRETYWNTDCGKVSWRNYGRYPAYAICVRRERLKARGIKYSLLFGGGATYMNGEDSLFLHDCLKAGLYLYRTTVSIGYEESGESTWFKGFTDKFYFDRGVLYHFLYGKMAPVFAFRYLFKKGREMCGGNSFFKCYKKALEGIRHGKKIAGRV